MFSETSWDGYWFVPQLKNNLGGSKLCWTAFVPLSFLWKQPTYLMYIFMLTFDTFHPRNGSHNWLIVLFDQWQLSHNLNLLMDLESYQSPH